MWKRHTGGQHLLFLLCPGSLAYTAGRPLPLAAQEEGEKIKKDKTVPPPAEIFTNRQEKLRQWLPFCMSLLSWGRISPRIFPGQTGPSARDMNIDFRFCA